MADGDLNQDAASIHQASATAFVMHAALADSDSSRASRLCRPGHQLIRAQTTDSPLTPLAGVFFTADRAERRLAPAIDLLREEAEREA